MSTKPLDNPANWDLQSPQVTAVEKLVKELTQDLPTAIETLSSVSYDGNGRLLAFVADGYSYLFDYPATDRINISISYQGFSAVKQVSLNSQGQLVGITTI
mgnify:FL=1